MTSALAGEYAGSVAAEVRAWLGRRGVTQTELAARLGVHKTWATKRLGKNARVVMDVEDLAKIAQALDIRVADLLPRLDSNQQPSGSRSPQVSGPRVTRDPAVVKAKLAAKKPPQPDLDAA